MTIVCIDSKHTMKFDLMCLINVKTAMLTNLRPYPAGALKPLGSGLGPWQLDKASWCCHSVVGSGGSRMKRKCGHVTFVTFCSREQGIFLVNISFRQVQHVRLCVGVQAEQADSKSVLAGAAAYMLPWSSPQTPAFAKGQDTIDVLGAAADRDAKTFEPGLSCGQQHA